MDTKGAELSGDKAAVKRRKLCRECAKCKKKKALSTYIKI